MKRKECDDKIRAIQTIDQIHVLPGDGRRVRGWDDQRGIQTINQFHVRAKDG